MRSLRKLFLPCVCSASITPRSRACTKHIGNNGSSVSTSASIASPSSTERSWHKPEVERKHRTRSEDMAELQNSQFFVPLELVSTAAWRVDDDVNVIRVCGKR